MRRVRLVRQHDSMQCGITCLQMICRYFGREYSLDALSKICFATTEGVSMLGINEAARILGFQTVSARATIEELSETPLPCILHWNQNHFVVLYKVKKGKKFYIADPGKGKTTYNLEEFRRHWISTRSNDEDKGIAMFFETTPAFFTYQMEGEDRQKEKRSFKFLFRYFKKYRKAFSWIVLGLLAGSALQLVLSFLTQSIVDVGIKNQDIGFIWLILLGQLMLTISRTAIDFARRWFLLRISMRINISLVSDCCIKLLKLPMSFFDTKLMGDLMQRMNDHSRVNNFLTHSILPLPCLPSWCSRWCSLYIISWCLPSSYWAASCTEDGWLSSCSEERCSIMNSSSSRPSITTEHTSSLLRCRKSSCRIASSASERSGRRHK